MSVLATVTLVVVPLAVGCITAAQHWCYRRRLNANLAKARADRDRYLRERDHARQLADRLADGLNEVTTHLREGRPGDAAVAAERALGLSSYEGDLLRTRRALEIVAAENAALRDRLGELTTTTTTTTDTDR